MKNDKNIQLRVEEALNSVDGIKRASPRPYLLTRINARLNRRAKTNWDKAAVFMSRPAVMVAGICLVLAINISVVLLNTPTSNNTVAERSANVGTDEDETSTSFATIDNY